MLEYKLHFMSFLLIKHSYSYSTNVVNMFIIVLITIISLANCLNSIKDDNIVEDDIKKVIAKYIDKVPDIEPQYVIHEGLSNVLSRYFKGKVSTFPLYKISLKIDRNPVKIPWTLANTNSTLRHRSKKARKGKSQKKFKYVPKAKHNKTTS